MREGLFKSVVKKSCVYFFIGVYVVFFNSRLRLASFDSSGKLICSRTTGYQILTLEKDQVCLLSFVSL